MIFFLIDFGRKTVAKDALHVFLIFLIFSFFSYIIL